MKYRVIEESMLSRFEHEVNKLISEGWEPIGGATVHRKFQTPTDQVSYSQAMIFVVKERRSKMKTIPSVDYCPICGYYECICRKGKE
jgi:hypothetical protein